MLKFSNAYYKNVFTILKEIGENSFGRKYKTKESVIVKIKKN